MKLVLASKNAHKLVEMRDILSQLGVEVVLESEVGVDVDVEETGATFEENAFLKARAVMEASGLPAIADDSGLCVDALNGAPGVYSARYGGPGPLPAFAGEHAGAAGPAVPLCLRHLLLLSQRGPGGGPGGVSRHLGLRPQGGGRLRL